MLTIDEIRSDLKDIRYYYSKKKVFESAAKESGKHIVFEKVERYNAAIKEAPLRLYDLYVSLYIENNTQEALAFDWGITNDYIKRLNNRLCSYLQKALKVGQKE